MTVAITAWYNETWAIPPRSLRKSDMKKIIGIVAVVFLSWASTVTASQEITILLGQYRSVQQYSTAITAAGYYISPSAMVMVRQVGIVQNRVWVDIVMVSQQELGLPESVPPSVVFARARERGLSLCSPEVALALRLRLPAQNFQWFNIAMSPLDMSGIPGLFVIGASADSGGLLASGATSPNLPAMRWVFTRARSR